MVVAGVVLVVVAGVVVVVLSGGAVVYLEVDLKRKRQKHMHFESTFL